jgi:hypothetical protein
VQGMGEVKQSTYERAYEALRASGADEASAR